MMRERFDLAKTLDEFIDTAKENRELWLSMRKRAHAPSDLVERSQSLPEKRHLLVLAEDWCGDAINSLVYLARLVEATPQLEMKVLERDLNLDLMDAHLSSGARAIPVVIVLDEEYRELGWWGSRPKPLQQWIQSEESQKLGKEDRYREVRRWYARDQGRTTLEEITRLLESTARLKDVA